jgi:DNA-binding CsgD family transcriptional regulator
MLAPEQNRHLKTVEALNSAEKTLKVPPCLHSKHPNLLQSIIESFVDGVLILSEQGEWIHANEYARRICHQLSSNRTEPLQDNFVPQQLWQICESLMDSRELFPEQRLIIEAEIDAKNVASLRVRVQWLDLDESDFPYLLITIEDRNQAIQNTALAEAKKYDLTPREAEVWLLRRSHHSYKEIAAKLFITVNTVKKHLKSVYAKQQARLWREDDRNVS